MVDQTDERDRSADGNGLDAAEAFSLLGNATRLEIVNRLHDESDASPVPFSTLYQQTDVTDSARFNYHLKQLVPHFVSKTDDGYRLTSSGRRLSRAVTAGIYTNAPQLDPFEIEGSCYDCGVAALWASYEDERLAIECRNCGCDVLGVRVPPTVVRGRDPEAVVDAFDRWSRMQVAQAHRGICPDCGGAVDSGVSEAVSGAIDFDAVAAFDCTVCGRTVMTSFGGLAARHPTVETFYRTRSQGDSPRDRPYWTVSQYVTGDHVEVVSRDPWLVRVSFFADGDACHVDIDDSLDVVETEVVPGEPLDEG